MISISLPTGNYSNFMTNVDFKNKQVRVELWEYDPKQFSEDNMADRLSVALSFAENEDERVEEAIEELLEGVWR